ncbi:MAG: hypothetical protein C0432_04055 [Candidatus Puniceispirillum sp.]|nr:hypothetical protein [Candidatus Pelagibacter sp.]MBA4283449.1 hypothetical protein [Candidatus Puniceispirillum sp.]
MTRGAVVAEQKNLLVYLKEHEYISNQIFKKGMKIKKFHTKMIKKLGLYAPTKDSLTKLENCQPALYPLHLIGEYGSDPYEEKWRDLMDFFQQIKPMDTNISVFIDLILDRKIPSIHTSVLPDKETIKNIIHIGYELIKME